MDSPKKVWLQRIFIALAMLVSAIVVYAALFELFIEIPGVNVPRFTFTPGIPGKTIPATRVQFFIDIPTVSWLVILSSAVICIAIGMWALGSLYRTSTGVKQKFFSMAILLLIQLVAYIVCIVDIFSSIGDIH